MLLAMPLAPCLTDSRHSVHMALIWASGTLRAMVSHGAELSPPRAPWDSSHLLLSPMGRDEQRVLGNHIMPVPDLSEIEHASQLSLRQAQKPRNIIRGDILAESLCQAWGKGSLLRKHDQKFNKWSCSQTQLLIQR